MNNGITAELNREVDNSMVETRIMRKASRMGSAMRFLRERDNMTQSDMIAELNKFNIEVKQTNSISNWENGLRRPSYEVLIAYSHFFDADIRYFFGDIDDPLPRRTMVDVDDEDFEAMWVAADEELRHDIKEYLRYRIQQKTGELVLPKTVSESPELMDAIKQLVEAFMKQ